MSQLTNQRGLALISELLIVALTIGLVMSVVIGVDSSKAARSNSLDGGISGRKLCPSIVGTTSDGRTIVDKVRC